MVLSTPPLKILHQSSVLLLPSPLHTPHYSRVTQIFLQVTRLGTLLKIRSVGGEEEWRKHSFLVGPDVPNQTVRHTALQPHKLPSARHILVIQVMRGVSTSMLSNFSLNSLGWIELKADEKSKNMMRIVVLGLSRKEWVHIVHVGLW